MFAIDQAIFEEPLRQLQELCLAHKMLVATAESCTGGLLSALLTHKPGSSGFFLGGVNAYANSIKADVLKVPNESLMTFGAVSPQVAQSMATGVQNLFLADFTSSITGVAGPGGGTPEKPVGLVCFGWSGPSGSSACSHQLSGSREEIRAQSCHIALLGLIQRLHAFITLREIP